MHFGKHLYQLSHTQYKHEKLLKEQFHDFIYIFIPIFKTIYIYDHDSKTDHECPLQNRSDFMSNSINYL